jgi:hypothetical protein
MIGVRKLGSFGVAITLVIAGLVLSVTPAYADAPVRYENVGNPGWCMASDSAGAYLPRCNRHDDSYCTQQWLWSTESSGPMIGLVKFKSPNYVNFCLTEVNGSLQWADCDSNSAFQHWDVWGRNGWVVLQRALSQRCMQPMHTGIVKPNYEIQAISCPTDRNNVPNIYAWRYFV